MDSKRIALKASGTIPQRTLGERLKAARQSANLSQSDLAALCGITQTAISDLERGKSLETVRSPQLASALGVSALWLVAGEGEMFEGAPLSRDLLRKSQRTVEEIQREVSSKVCVLIQSGKLSAAEWQHLDDTLGLYIRASVSQ